MLSRFASVAPLAISQTSPMPSTSQSSCEGFAMLSQLSAQSDRPSPSVSSGLSITLQPHAPGVSFSGSVGQPSHTFPAASPSEFVCSALGTKGQLSKQSLTLSPSVSTSRLPQPQAPGAVFNGSFGHPSHTLPTRSPSVSCWFELDVLGQLSTQLLTPSPSASALQTGFCLSV